MIKYTAYENTMTMLKMEVNKLANIKSAQKRIKVIQKKTLINKMRISQTKTAIKRFEQALAVGDFELATSRLRLAQKKLNQVATKGSIHKNAAARKVSRLTKKLNLAQKAKVEPKND